MAAFLISFSFILFIIDSNTVKAFNCHHKAGKGFFRDSTSKVEPYTTSGYWNQRIYLIKGSSHGRNITRFSYAAVKMSKHGNNSLHLPGKGEYFDLTIYMDVQVNPGPASDSDKVGSCAKPCCTFFMESTTKPHYSREQLLSIRPNCYSTKWLSPVLLHHLKDLTILKYRGKAGARQFSGKTLDKNIIYAH